MHNYSGMGLGGGTGAGIDPFITNKQVVFLGDSTFFHSGMLGISNALKQGQDITYVILDNSTTAMTGHQPTPSMDVDIVGEHTYKQNIDRISEAMLGEGVHVIRANPAYRETWRQMLEETILLDGVKVIVADKECVSRSTGAKPALNAPRSRNAVSCGRRVTSISTPTCASFAVNARWRPAAGADHCEHAVWREDSDRFLVCVADTACTKIYACRRSKRSPSSANRNYPSRLTR